MSIANDVLPLVDKNTGLTLNYKRTTTDLKDGTPMTDAKADGKMYRKDNSGNYYVHPVLISREPITPQMFGAKGDNVNDDSDALNNFFNFLMNRAPRGVTAQMIGDFRVTKKIICRPTALGTAAINSIHCSCKILADYTSDEEIFLVQNWWRGKFTGHLTIQGKGTTTWSTRTNGSGLVLLDCSRFSFDKLSVYYTKFDAVMFIGLSYGIVVSDELITNYCGMATTGAREDYTNGSVQVSIKMKSYLNDANTSVPYQRSQVTVDTIPPGVEKSTSYPQNAGGNYIVNTWEHCFLKIGERLHIILGLDVPTKTFTVYPHVDTTYPTAVDKSIKIYGGGLYTTGGDASCSHINSHDALVCGYGVYNRALYPASFNNATYQFCGVGAFVGSFADSVTVGGVTTESYYENCDFDIKSPAGGSNTSYVFVNTVALNLDKCGGLLPGWGTAEYNLPPYNGFQGITIGKRRAQTNYPNNFNYNGSRTLYLGDDMVYKADTSTITIVTDNNLNKLWGYSKIEVLLMGTGANKQPTGTITVVATGKTINGQANLVLTGLTRPLLLTLYYDGSNYTAIKGDLIDTLAPATATVQGTVLKSAAVTDVTATDAAVVALADAVAITTADPTDAATTQAMAIELKAKLNLITTLLNDTKAKFNTNVTLSNSSKAKINAKLASDRASGQQT